MKKGYISFLIILFFSFFPSIYASSFDISGQNVILYNLNDDTILYEKNSEEKTSIASLTKIMTSLVALKNIDDLNEYVTITDADFLGTTGYSKAGFSVGDKVTYLDLLYGILLPSGAEAVNAIVNNTLKNSDDYVAAMNDLAKEIGLENTSFSNMIGKDAESNYSTAKDVATLLKYALKNPTFKMIFTTKEYTATNGLLLESTLNNYQDILQIDLISGAKSGFTQGAGRCLASITTINGVNYLLVVIKSSTSAPYNAVKDTITIYDYYSSNYSYQVILEKNQIIKSIPVKWSPEKDYEITSNKEVELFLKNGTSDNLTYVYDGLEEIEINTKAGIKLGTISIYNDSELLYQGEVYLNSDIYYYHPYLWLLGIIILIMIVIWKCVKSRKKRKRRY